ncbi:hypothetical protein Aperf_G00000117521 [Anoplocephala perfoliata]
MCDSDHNPDFETDCPSIISEETDISQLKQLPDLVYTPNATGDNVVDGPFYDQNNVILQAVQTFCPLTVEGSGDSKPCLRIEKTNEFHENRQSNLCDPLSTAAEKEITRLRAALVAAERARSRQTALLSQSLIDREVIVSEARACEQELSEVEIKMLQLKGEIQNKEARIAQLEEEIIELRETNCELEAKNTQISAEFEDILSEKFSHLARNNNEYTPSKVRSPGSEAKEALTNREELRTQVYTKIINQLEARIEDLKCTMENQKDHFADSMKQICKLEVEKEHLINLTKTLRERIEDLEREFQNERRKLLETETELIASRKELFSVLDKTRELTLEQTLLREQKNTFEKRFESMHSEIIELNTALQAANHKVSILEVNLEDKGRSQAKYESQFLKADRDAKAAHDLVASLEEEKKILTASKGRLQATIDELRSTYAAIDQDKSKADREIKRLKYVIAKHDEEKCTTENILNECLQKARISPPQLNGRNPSRSSHSGLDVNKMLKLVSDKMAGLIAENENLSHQLVTRQSMILEESSQNAASINENLIQLEAHLRSAREDNKQLCLQRLLLRRQLEAQKIVTARYRDAKHALQVKLSGYEQLHRHNSVASTRLNKKTELYTQLTRSFEEKAKDALPTSKTFNQEQSIRGTASKVNKIGDESQNSKVTSRL